MLAVQKVIRAIEAAGVVMGELAKERTDMDKIMLNTAVKAFSDEIQVGAKGPVHNSCKVLHPPCLLCTACLFRHPPTDR